MWGAFANGHLGVSIFFVISGFLITYLLRQEAEKTGHIDLLAFYKRRTLRIFPAFYAYLGIIAVLMACKLVPVGWTNFVLAGTYTYNYEPLARAFNPDCDVSTLDPRRWYIGHSWTLCLEEQFYLLWPSLLAFAGLFRGARIAAGIILLEPVLRVLTHLLFPSMRGIVGPMLPWALDPLMFGALAALWQGHPRFESMAARVLRGWLAAAAAMFVLYISPWFGGRLGGFWTLAFAPTLESMAILLILLWLVRHSHSRAGQFFNLPLVARIGVLSYSLYLWQQVFFVPWKDHWAVQQFPLNIVCTLAAAVTSYYFIEKPFLYWKQKFVPPVATAQPT